MFVSLSLQHSRLSRGKLALPCEGMICLLPLLYNYINAHPFNSPLSATTQVSRYQKGKTNLDFTVSGSGISWAICKSAHRSRQITTPAPHHSVFYRPDALPAAQPTVSKQWRHCMLLSLQLFQFFQLALFSMVTLLIMENYITVQCT